MTKNHELINKPKVVIVASLGPRPYLGGIENVIHTLVNSNLKSKYEFLFFDTYRTPDHNRNIINKIVFAIKLFYTSFEFFIKTKPVIVHIHFCSNIDFWKHSICLLVAKLLQIKIIFHLHGGGFEKFYIQCNSTCKYFIKLIFKLPNIVIALSHDWAKILANIANERKILILGNPIDCEKFIKNNDIGKKYFSHEILLMGRIGRHKGHFDAVNALALIIKKYNNVKMSFAGLEDEDGMVIKLKNLAKKLGVENNINFLGAVIGENKINLLHRCDIMILPSYGENMPLSIMEGMAAKLPVIASSVGATPELLDNGKLGTLIDPGDREGLAKAISDILDNPDKAKNIAKDAQMKICKTYDIKIIINQLNIIYKNLINA